MSKRHGTFGMLRGPRWAVAVLACTSLALGIYACAMNRAVEREIADTPRDPQTGVVIGTEALDLDPPPGADYPTTACLLLHGFLGSRIDYADLGERLAARGFHVRMARLPGHGTTPRDMARQTPESLLAAVREEFFALKGRYDAVDVIGFSMGGALATLLASREAVDRLVLVAPYYGVTYQWYYGLPAEAWNALLSPIVPFVGRAKYFIKVNRPEAKAELFSYRHMPTRASGMLIRLGKQARARDVLAAVRCPALLVMSEGDEAAAPDRARKAFEALGSPIKRERWLDARNNHHVLWDYDRERAKDAIVAFLTSEPRQGHRSARH